MHNKFGCLGLTVMLKNLNCQVCSWVHCTHIKFVRTLKLFVYHYLIHIDTWMFLTLYKYKSKALLKSNACVLCLLFPLTYFIIKKYVYIDNIVVLYTLSRCCVYSLN